MLSCRNIIRNLLRTICVLLICGAAVSVSHAQLGFSPVIKKPKEFENRTLRSEKSENNKFSVPKRFIQNTITHYNYYFNANNKLNEIIGRAKLAWKDDYSQLLPFYNYSLDVTAADSIQLDSISYKVQSGIVLHDLRNDWADNLYLIWGASYYLRQEFDSAFQMFQFINYAFAKKESDGYYLAIGSARDGNKANSISTEEKGGIVREMFTQPPSRNDAFIWQIRNHLAQEHFTQAASLIQALKNDPEFPSRLRPDLEEVQALSFYKQGMWDSTAAHLQNALSNATNRNEQSRWEYLIAQLYERTGKMATSEEFYAKAIVHTTDPILDVYARLGSVRVNRDETQNTIDKNVATLIKMAHRDKYVDYRDIIYYMAAQMELERENTDAALDLLLKSTHYIANNPEQRNKAFLQLAEITYRKRQYRLSNNFYDSLRMDDPTLVNVDDIRLRKTSLQKLVTNLDIMARQDSMQRLAGMPEEDRKNFVKKLARQIRKQQGLKDESATMTTGSAGGPATPQTAAPSLFSSSKGEWYFYNAASRQRGLADFKSRWGTRPNADNWRRSGALMARVNPNPENPNAPPNSTGAPTPDMGNGEVTYETLYDRIPLTPEKIKISNDSIEVAMLSNGILYVQELEDCLSGTTTLEQFRFRFPDNMKMDEVLFNLYYCYKKNGETTNAEQVKKLMADKFGDSDFTSMVTTGKSVKTTLPQEEPTHLYERIYDQFIEGNFAEAVAQKKTADSLYGQNYWTPQLLYIEAVYYIKERQDSIAKRELTNIITQFAGQPLAIKSQNLLSVLERRNQIEAELRSLVIVMPAEDSLRDQAYIATPLNRPPTPDSMTRKPVNDTAIQKPVIKKPAVDTAAKTPKMMPPVIRMPVMDSVAKKPVIAPDMYSFSADKPHYVVIVLNKVDPVFVNEAKNAFYRYNKDTYYNKTMDAELVQVDADTRLLLISPFTNAADAMTYVDATKPKTASTIIPWLKGGKYSYIIITAENLEILKASKDVNKYKEFLDKNMPGKF